MSTHLPPDGIRSTINNSTNDTIDPVNDLNQMDIDTTMIPHAGSNNSNAHSIFARLDQISSKSQNRLLPGNMLDDELINHRLLHLQSQETKDGVTKAPKTHFCSSHFFSKLYNQVDGYNFDGVSPWISETKLLYRLVDCEMIVLPIFQNRGHWVLIVLNVTDKLIEYCDSLGRESYEKGINVCFSCYLQIFSNQIVVMNRSQGA